MPKEDTVVSGWGSRFSLRHVQSSFMVKKEVFEWIRTGQKTIELTELHFV